MFEYYSAKNVKEVVSLLDECNQDTYILAGGTDLLVGINKRNIKPKKVIDICDIDELKYVKIEGDLIKIGSLMTFSELENNKILKKNVNLLSQACGEVGSTQIRNLGTIGGNIVNAAAVGDSIVALIALDASIELQSHNNKRVVKLKDFYSGSGKTDIKENEILTEISFKIPGKNSNSSFVKLGKRKALAISVLSVGIILELENNQTCKNISIAVGATSRYPFRLIDVEKSIIGKKVDRESLEYIAEEISNVIYENLKNNELFSHEAPYKKSAVKGVSLNALSEIVNNFEC